MRKNWQKYTEYWRLRLAEIKGTPYSVAAGAACGIAVSFTPFVGAHLMLAMLSAWLIRGSVAAAALGTAAGNPWTFPFIWAAVLYTGRRILGLDGASVAHVDFAEIFSQALKALINFDFDLFFSDIWPILWPMTVGCIPFCIAVWLVSYHVVKTMLERPQKK